VMQQINGKMILSCGAVVSPLGWSGWQKLGMDLYGIHVPVPHFNEGPALKFVTKIFEKGLRADVPLARANWFIMDTAEHSLVSGCACSWCKTVLRAVVPNLPLTTANWLVMDTDRHWCVSVHL